jgi:transposase-like protein
VEEAIRASLRAGGKSIHAIAREHGVGSGTVQRVKAEMAGTIGRIEHGGSLATRAPTHR